MAAQVDGARLELYLPATEAAVPQARRALDGIEALEAWPEQRFSLRLLVTELFTNGVRHGARAEGSRIRLCVDVREGRVRVEIGDRGRGFVSPDATWPDDDATSGRGLAFLDALADRWGVVKQGENLVWLEIDLPEQR